MVVEEGKDEGEDLSGGPKSFSHRDVCSERSLYAQQVLNKRLADARKSSPPPAPAAAAAGAPAGGGGPAAARRQGPSPHAAALQSARLCDSSGIRFLSGLGFGVLDSFLHCSSLFKATDGTPAGRYRQRTTAGAAIYRVFRPALGDGVAAVSPPGWMRPLWLALKPPASHFVWGVPVHRCVEKRPALGSPCAPTLVPWSGMCTCRQPPQYWPGQPRAAC
jgi:hypothetical protein